MPRAPPAGLFAITVAVLFVCYIFWVRSHEQPLSHLSSISDHFTLPKAVPEVSSDVTTGSAIMPKLGNETAKAELGRAAWKLLHTTMARFPDSPTADESTALKQYIYLFARLYPCGECATHFQGILKKYPPQVSSRSAAAVWACFVHNEVNISQNKPVFDCANIGDFYDCGCAEDEKDDTLGKAKQGEQIAAEHEPVEIEKDGLMNGG